MQDNLAPVSDEQLAARLVEAYENLRPFYPETNTVELLKGELYRRGHQRDEIVTLALAALIRRSMN